MSKAIDLSNQQFGKLKVIKRAPSPDNRARWQCQCECGGTCVVKGTNLRAGQTTSCGCNRRLAGERARTHNLSHSRIYRTWANMKTRCYNAKSENYPEYGGRGIRVCEEWLEFEPFNAWAVNNGYAENLSIDRMNVNGNYEPSNCQWITMEEQQGNKTSSHLETFRGETHTIAEWARTLGMNPSTISARLRRGWGIDKIASSAHRI